MKSNTTFIFAGIMSAIISNAFATGENTVTSKSYVDTQDALKQDKIPAKRRANFTLKLVGTAQKLKQIDYEKPAPASLSTKFKFYACRFLQVKNGKADPEYTDYKYWKECIC